jgi:hypothetical protein
MDRKIKVITTTSDLSKCYQLRRSLIHHGYDFHFIRHDWEPVGFLGKIHETYKYLKSLEGYTHFLYTDAWDTFAMAGPEELAGKMPDGILISAERACYPYPELAGKYPSHESPWHFVNGGGWCGEIEAFIRLYEDQPPTAELNDQVWLTNQFLKLHGEGWVRLDYECRIFQTLGFCPESDFEGADGRLYNTVNQTYPLFIHGNGHTPMNQIYDMLPVFFDCLQDVRSMWADDEAIHKRINEEFTALVNLDPELKAYRDWIEEKIFGFGERSFLWMWKLLIDEIPEPNFLEIGVFRGQILGLIRMLSPKARITGLTPLTSAGGHWESDYEADIKLLHETFNLQQPAIIKGLSTEDDALAKAADGGPYDIVYIDGGHDYATARHDVYRYSSMVKVGGYLVVDDCAHRYNLPNGYFRGIESVSKAVDELLPNEYYEEVFNVVHNRIFKRIK